MPLDAIRRDWPEPRPDPNEAILARVLADPLFRQCCIELIEAALNAAGIDRGPVSPEQFAAIAARSELQRRLQALIDAVLTEQARGWRAS